MRILKVLFVAGLLLQTAVAAEATATRCWEVRCSPKGGCTEAVVDALGKAKTNVLVQAYSFTSAQIARALVDAHRRGAKVQVILDKSQRTEKYSSATFLLNQGISCVRIEMSDHARLAVHAAGVPPVRRG